MKTLKALLIAVAIYQAAAVFILNSVSKQEVPVVNYSWLSTHVLLFLEATTPLKSRDLAIDANLIISSMILNGDMHSVSDMLENGINAYKHLDAFLTANRDHLSDEDRFALLMEELIILNRLWLISDDTKLRTMQMAAYDEIRKYRHAVPPEDANYLDAESILTLGYTIPRPEGSVESLNLYSLKKFYAGMVACKNGKDSGATDIDFFKENYSRGSREILHVVSRNWNMPLLTLLPILPNHHTPERCAKSLQSVVDRLLTNASAGVSISRA